MSVVYKQQTRDKLWALLEAHAPFTAIYDKPGKKIQRQTNAGWLQEHFRRTPGFFPRVSINNGRFTLSAYNLPSDTGRDAQTYAQEDINFAGHWPVRRRLDFIITATASGLDAVELDAAEEEIQIALLKGGPRLKLEFVKQWGPIAASPQDEKDVGGVRRLKSVLTLPVLLEFDGHELIT